MKYDYTKLMHLGGDVSSMLILIAKNIAKEVEAIRFDSHFGVKRACCGVAMYDIFNSGSISEISCAALAKISGFRLSDLHSALWGYIFLAKQSLHVDVVHA